MLDPRNLAPAAALTSAIGMSAVGQCFYEVAIVAPPLCSIFGPPPTEAFGINEQGDVTGMRWQCGSNWGQPIPFRWTPETGFVTISMGPNLYEGQGFDINDAGQIVGEVTYSGDAFGVLAFVLDGRALTIIPPLPGGSFSQAIGINSIGQVVGAISDATPVTRGFVWNDGVLNLLEGPFGPTTIAHDINDNGQIVGWMGSGQTSDSHAFLYTEGKFLDLGVIPGGTTALAFALNDLGDVVGAGCIPQGKDPCVAHAFLWSGGKMSDLGTLPGFSASSARDINNFGQIVGFCTRDNIPWKAFIWQNGVMTDLNDLIVAGPPVGVGTAHAINDAGQIVGRGGIDGHGTGYLLTPLNVPIGDVDRNCHVDAWDLFMLLRQWGPCPSCQADLDDDDVVGIVDLLVLLANWTG